MIICACNAEENILKKNLGKYLFWQFLCAGFELLHNFVRWVFVVHKLAWLTEWKERELPIKLYVMYALTEILPMVFTPCSYVSVAWSQSGPALWNLPVNYSTLNRETILTIQTICLPHRRHFSNQRRSSHPKQLQRRKRTSLPCRKLCVARKAQILWM